MTEHLLIGRIYCSNNIVIKEIFIITRFIWTVKISKKILNRPKFLSITSPKVVNCPSSF